MTIKYMCSIEFQLMMYIFLESEQRALSGDGTMM